MASDRDILIEIGNMIGCPTATYSPETEVNEWRQRARLISRVIQNQMKVLPKEAGNV